MKTNKIIIMPDYKDVFLSNANCNPYRSGMRKEIIKKYFNNNNFEVQFMQFSEIDFRKMNFKDEYVLYTSSEDVGYHYKSYIEDIILGLHLQGAKLIPEFKYLRANNNKVFMEILRDIIDNKDIKSLDSRKIGVLEDIYKYQAELKNWNKYVIKTASGAMSKGVFLANSFDELIEKSKKISRTLNIYRDLRDLARKFYFKGYKMESKFRNKFIIQEFVPNLQNDWKVLVYWNKIFILKRYTRKSDFRASGSGNFVFDKDFPIEILDYAFTIRESFDVPNVSLDICFDGKEFYLIEFQAIYFGTTTLVESPFYYQKVNSTWNCIDSKSELELVFVESIVKYIESKTSP